MPRIHDDDPPGDRLALNIADLTRLPDVVLASLRLGDRLGKTVIQTDKNRPDEAAAELTCGLVDAACVADVVRAADRRAGRSPCRIYLRKAGGSAWRKLPADAVLAEAKNGAVALHPDVFPAKVQAADPPPRRPVKLQW